MYKAIRILTLLFVFLIPWQARWIIVPGELNGAYWEYATRSLYATELIFFAFVALLLAAVFYRMRKHAGFISWKRIFVSTGGLVTLFVLWVFASVLWSVDAGVALEHAVLLIEGIVLIGIIGSGIVSLEYIVWTVIASAFLQAGLGLVQFFTQSIPPSTLFGIAAQDPARLGVSVVETASARWLRAYGSFPHPNMLGGWLVAGIVALWYETLSLRDLCGSFVKKCAIRYLNRFLILFVVVFCLLSTFSRSAYLAGAIFIVCAALLHGYQKKYRVVVSVFLLSVMFATALFGLLYHDILSSRIAGSSELDARAGEERISYLDESKTLFVGSPIIGYGIGNEGLAVHQYIDSTRDAWSYQPVHNVGVLLVVELGIVGLLIVLGIVWDGLRRIGSIVDLLPLIPIVIIGAFDHYLLTLYPGVLIGGVVIGIFLLRLSKK